MPYVDMLRLIDVTFACISNVTGEDWLPVRSAGLMASEMKVEFPEDAHLLSHLDHLLELIHDMKTEKDFLDDHRSISGYTFASTLFFDEGDVGGVFYQVIDDFYRQQAEGDSETYLVRVAFDPADSRQTQQTLHIMRAIFRMADHLEDVLTIIGDKI